MPEKQIYIFSDDQLYKALSGTVDMYNEYIHQHGYGHDSAVVLAACETIEGLNAEKFLASIGQAKITSQLAGWPE